MAKNKHKPEDLMQIFRLVIVLLILEERNENVELPIIIQLFLLFIDFINSDDALGTERSQFIFHQSQKFLLHVSGEILIADLIVSQKKLFEFEGTNIIDIFLNVSVHFLPKLLVRVLQLLHQVVH